MIRTRTPRRASWFASISPVGPAPTTRTSVSVFMRGASIAVTSRLAPFRAHARDELVGDLGAPTAGGVIGKVVGSFALPVLDDGIHDRPCRLDLVRPGEQGRIAEHAIEEQRFVRFVPGLAERLVVAEVHVDRHHPHVHARHLDLEAQRDAFVRLDPDGEHIDRKSTRLNSSHGYISYAVFCLKKKKKNK